MCGNDKFLDLVDEETEFSANQNEILKKMDVFILPVKNFTGKINPDFIQPLLILLVLCKFYRQNKQQCVKRYLKQYKRRPARPNHCPLATRNVLELS